MLRSLTWLRGLTAVVAVSLLAASVAEAQQKKEQPNKSQRGQRQRGGGGGFGGFGGGGGGGAPGALQLIGREEVRKELKISEEQQGIIRELSQSARPNFRALFGGNFRDLPREEREKKLAELRKTSEKKSKEAEADLYGLILDEVQSQRLKQIVLQQKGNRALTEPAVAKALGLSAAQSAKIKMTMEASQKKQQELFAGLGGAFGGRRPQGGDKGAKGAKKNRAEAAFSRGNPEAVCRSADQGRSDSHRDRQGDRRTPDGRTEDQVHCPQGTQVRTRPSFAHSQPRRPRWPGQKGPGWSPEATDAARRQEEGCSLGRAAFTGFDRVDLAKFGDPSDRRAREWPSVG